MTNSETGSDENKKIIEDLFNMAIERNTLKEILKSLPEDTDMNQVTLEYEIQLLKILSVGWGISFFMANHPQKVSMAEGFWTSIQKFSQSISEMTATNTGKDLDYFNILRQRVDIYVKALNHYSDANDPAIVVGPTFAMLCGHEEDVYAIESGKKIFNAALNDVRNRLQSILSTTPAES